MLYLAAIILVIAIILHSDFIEFTYIGHLQDEDGNDLYDEHGPIKGEKWIDWSPWVMTCLGLAFLCVLVSL